MAYLGILADLSELEYAADEAQLRQHDSGNGCELSASQSGHTAATPVSVQSPYQLSPRVALLDRILALALAAAMLLSLFWARFWY